MNPDRLDRHNGSAFYANNKENLDVAQATTGLKHEATKAKSAKRDFFGRIIVNEACPKSDMADSESSTMKGNDEKRMGKKAGNVWVSFHEGFSNAVRKPVTLEDLMKDL